MCKLSVIIVNWNTGQLLTECLESLFKQQINRIQMNVFVVDNHSSDSSCEQIRKRFPIVHLIENEHNVGYAAANNQVLPLCQSDFILLLNPDTSIHPDAISKLINFLQTHSDVGAVGPLIVNPTGRLRVLSCGHQPTLVTMLNHYWGLSSLFPRLFKGINLFSKIHDDKNRQVEWISGACFMIRRKVIEQIGLLSENWFMYAEDFDWCLRMILAGWKIYHVPRAIVTHHFGVSIKKNRQIKTLWVDSLRSYFILTCNPSSLQLFLFDFIFFTGLLLRSVGYWVKGISSQANSEPWFSEAIIFFEYAIAVAGQRYPKFYNRIYRTYFIR